jgi:ABC-2 type transport system permease protein
MIGLRIALGAELRKAVASRVLGTVSILLVGGVAVLAGSLVLAARTGNAQVTAQLGLLADEQGWPLLIGVVLQITSAGALLAFGVALSWLFGREFSDGTVTGLFALPIRRSTIATAKLAIYFGWAIVCAIALMVLTGCLGLGLGYGVPDAAAMAGLVRLWVLTVFSALLAVPAGWATTLGRGLLPGIGVTIGIVVLAQVGVLSGVGGWVPFAAPALWAMGLAPVTVAQLLLPLLVPVLFGFATARSWSRLQLDR